MNWKKAVLNSATENRNGLKLVMAKKYSYEKEMEKVKRRMGDTIYRR